MAIESLPGSFVVAHGIGVRNDTESRSPPINAVPPSARAIRPVPGDRRQQVDLYDGYTGVTFLLHVIDAVVDAGSMIYLMWLMCL